MKQVQQLRKLNSMSFFDFETLSQLFDIERESLYVNITRWTREGYLIQLKKGMYVTKEYYESIADMKSYNEFIANQLRTPSYLSLEYVLSLNQVLTESVFLYSSVTSKTTRAYLNDLGSFSYRKISDKLFNGYKIVNKEPYNIAIATKSKALFDYLYLQLFREKDITKDLIDDFRLNLDEFSESEIVEFNYYSTLSGIEKYSRLPNLLFG